MEYIDCKSYAQEILDKVKSVQNKKELRIFTMGDNPASQSYVKGKIKDCEYCNIPYSHITVSSEMELNCSIFSANEDDSVGGVIIQLPLPSGVDEEFFTNQVRIDKDVDGFKSCSKFSPCTPEGIMYVLHKEIGNLSGKTALVIGRGKLVGKPIVQMLLDEDCTVTIAHSKTTNIDDLLSRNDIIISAVGRPNLVDLKKCCAEIVIDVGVNRDSNGKLCGDCFNFDPNDKDIKVTPVPGGIGLMTRAILMKHMANL